MCVCAHTHMPLSKDSCVESLLRSSGLSNKYLSIPAEPPGWPLYYFFNFTFKYHLNVYFNCILFNFNFFLILFMLVEVHQTSRSLQC